MNVELEEIKEWKSLRKELNNRYEYHNNPNWKTAITLFKNRLNRKYFNPIENLISMGVNKGEGFTILTTQCALIESLATFRSGKIFNHKKQSKSPNYEYSRSARIFVNFLTSDIAFKDNFWVKKNNKTITNKPFNAKSFYSDVRCGLLHEARTKGKWIINTHSVNPVSETVFLVKDDAHIKIYRSILHYRLKESVNQYCTDLKESNSNGRKLRKLFGRKLDHMFGVKNNEYDWWKAV